MGDFFHMNIEETDIAESIRAAGGFLKHIHLADSNRRHPGAGHIDFRPALAALGAINFDGYMALECHVTVELPVLLEQSARFLRSLAWSPSSWLRWSTAEHTTKTPTMTSCCMLPDSTSWPSALC